MSKARAPDGAVVEVNGGECVSHVALQRSPTFVKTVKGTCGRARLRVTTSTLSHDSSAPAAPGRQGSPRGSRTSPLGQ
jgi:hypothetical protein